MSPREIVIDGVRYREVSGAETPAGFAVIANLRAGKFHVSIKAKVVKDWGLNQFTRADGTEGKVYSLLVADDSGSIKVALWGEQADKVAGVKEGDILIVKRGYTKDGFKEYIELHASTKSEVELIREGGTQTIL